MENKYKKIERYFIDAINQEKFNVGDQLPPEVEITKDFGYSRMTINKALNNLEKKGYITRISGRGTFVKAKSTVRMINDNISFSEIIRNQGMEAGSMLLSYELLNSSTNEALYKTLDISADTKLHHFTRLRTGNNKPMAISDDYLNAKLIKKMDFNLMNPSLYAYLKRLKLPVIQNYVEIKAVKATEEQQKILNISDDFLLKTIANVDTITTSNHRQHLGLFCSYYNPKLYTYRLITNS
ncbi:GntR family transcriptional regulator [Sporolactobacillus terrae]|uniref:GntR family transcriptional regulator n=1 Tax=Sporolactobacillus terrae TaxID=269673 RepID=UPI000491CFE9|nr:GntR family transcriptional regulator [Sporolactobacillus terrae]